MQIVSDVVRGLASGTRVGAVMRTMYYYNMRTYVCVYGVRNVHKSAVRRVYVYTYNQQG